MCQVSPDSAEAQQQPDSAFVACGKWRPLTDVVFTQTVNRRGRGRELRAGSCLVKIPPLSETIPAVADVTSYMCLFYCSSRSASLFDLDL